MLNLLSGKLVRFRESKKMEGRRNETLKFGKQVQCVTNMGEICVKWDSRTGSRMATPPYGISLTNFC